MGSLLSYSGISTKIRAMQSHLIQTTQLEDIVQMKTISQISSYLKQTPAYARLWASVDESPWHREELERQLRHSVFYDFFKLYRFANKQQRSFLDLYAKRYEVQMLKQLITNLYDHRPNTTVDIRPYQEFFRKHSRLDLEKLASAETMEEFLDLLKGNEFYVPLHRVQGNSDLVFDDCMALDLYYFSQIWTIRQKLFSRKDLKEITMAYGESFDMLNLQYIYRSIHYYQMPPAEIFSILIPVNYRLKKDDVIALVHASTDQEWEERFSLTYYGKKYRKLKALDLDHFYDTAMRDILERLARQNPSSVAILFHYMYSKEKEVNRLIIAIEHVRYGVSPELSMKYLQHN